MSRFSKTIKNNIPLIIVATITVLLFLYPYLKIGNAPSSEKKKSAISITVSKTTKENMQKQYDAIGIVRARSEISVLSQVDGVLLKVNVEIGDTVSKGQSLAALDSRLLLAELSTAKAQLVKSTDELKRAQNLVERKLAIQTRLENAIAQKTADDKNVERLTTILSSANFPSPINGIITAQNVFSGNTVQTGGILFMVSDVSKITINVKVPESIATSIKSGDTARINTETHSFSAKVLRVYPASDMATHQVGIELDAGAVFPLLKPGYQVRVVFSDNTRHQTLTIGRSAISGTINNNEATVFVIKNGKAEKRKIKTGLVLENQVEIIQGLFVGETVATKGIGRLKNGSIVTIVAE